MTKLRRFEFRSGNSNKFWEITSDGTELLTKWGRIGTDGQTKTKDFASQEALKKEYEKLIKQKVNKGYIEVKVEDETEIKEEIDKAVEKEEPKVKEPGPGEKVHLPNVNFEPRVVFDDLSEVNLYRKDSKPWEPIDLEDEWKNLTKRCNNPPPPKKGIVYTRPQERYGASMLPFNIQEMEMGITSAATPQLAELTRKVVELLKAPCQPKEPFDLDVLSAAFISLNCEVPFLPYWAHRVSCLFSLKILLNSVRYRLDHHWHARSKSNVSFIAPRTKPGWHRYNWGLIKSIRSLVNSAPDAQYTEAKQFAAERRESADLLERCSFSFLFPDVREWAIQDANDCIAVFDSPENIGWLLSCLQDPELADSLVDKIIYDYTFNGDSACNLKSMVHLLGLKAENILKKVWKNKPDFGNIISQAYFHIKSPGAADFFVSLLDDRELKKRAKEYLQEVPEFAIPALIRTRRPFAEGLLSSLIRKHNDVVDAILPFLPETETNAIEKIRRKVVLTVPEAEDDQLPAILITPPWKAQKIKKTKPMVVKDLTPLDWPESIEWREHQHQEWSIACGAYSPTKEGDRELLEAVAKTKKFNWLSGYKLFMATDEVAVKVWNEIPPSDWDRMDNDDLKQILARYQLKALPGLLAFAQSKPAQSAAILERVNSVKVAPIMGRALVGSKSGRRSARNWLESFPKTAAVGLIPIAVGPPGTERNNAENALRYMAAKNQAAAIKEIAGKYGAKTVEAVETILDFNPLLDFPDRIAKMPDWWAPGSFTRPLLKDKSKALPIHALENLGVMLSFTPLSPPYPGINLVREIIDPASMFEFCWDLFTTWLAVEDGKTKTDWCMMSLAHFGGDEAARRLTPLIRSWPGEASHARAARGLELLAAIGSDVALMSLYSISQKLKYKKLQEKAHVMVDHIARSLELSSDQLADRLVPDLGLEENGSKVLDFGPRKFIVGFDEQLKPFIKDENGKPIKNLPNPGKRDDEEKAAQAVAAWKALKKDARAAASTQIQRLELAMCNCRRWTADVFREFLVNHPLVCHLSRRLIWGIYNGGGLKTTFRVAEDNSFADIHDEDFQLEKEVEIGIPHPIEFSDDVSAGWGTVFADYEILQPFPQLGREVYHLSDEYSETSTLDIVKGVTVPSGAIRGLESRGWRRGFTEDHGFIREYKKTLPGGFELDMELDPGIMAAAGYGSMFDEQTLGLAILRKGQQKVNFNVLAPIVYSELFRDLILLKS